MSTHDKSHPYATGGIIANPTIPMMAECCHHGHERCFPLSITTAVTISEVVDPTELSEAIITQLKRRAIA